MADNAPQEEWGVDGSIIVYGIASDVMCLVPFLLYLILDDASSWAQYH